MAKIISIRKSIKKTKSVSFPGATDCDHKYVVAYTHYRTVNCALCGANLDPFDVLVDMLKGYIPPDGPDHEERLLSREIEKRNREGQRKETDDEKKEHTAGRIKDSPE